MPTPDIVQVTGSVIDAFVDETDPDVWFYILNSHDKQIAVSVKADSNAENNCERLIGAKISTVGTCSPKTLGSPVFPGQTIQSSLDRISVLTPAPADPFSVPSIETAQPNQIQPTEHRKISGVVVASWPTDNFLIRTRSNQLARVNITRGHMPNHGETIEVVGIPEADLLRINLTRCLCRRITPMPTKAQTAERVTARQLLYDKRGRNRVDPCYNGRRVILSGKVTELSSLRGSHFQFILVCSNTLRIPVYIPYTLAQPLPHNSIVEVDGICIVDTETWRPNNIIPKISELLISVSDMSHIRTIRNPPWWTSGKMLFALSGLLIVAFGTFFWNLSLRRVLKRKSKALENELSARLESNLKTRERTRLAVELHDSISQNLSGLAMEIGSAIRLAPTGIDSMLPHLNIASRTLQSCRDDLRDCLWDLRSNALEVDTMDEAIKTTLRPIIGDLTPIIRFNVLRKRLSDNTAHALLRIIHELVSNAICHGHARTIRIAGSIEDRRLLFSVRDDGCGFDVTDHPGATDGHFGLEGIRERIRRFNGTMDIVSAPTQGTKVTIAIDVSLPEEEDLIET